MSHRIISTENAPCAVGPYSQGCIGGKLLFISGQLPIDVKTGELEQDDIRKATQLCMSNLLAIAKAGHQSAHLVKVNIFLTSMVDFAAVNEIYATFFDAEPPARACVEVSGLPKGAKIEIEGIAVLPE
jgi:2-iminobutanoate/2-iminopropanoate deaminase